MRRTDDREEGQWLGGEAHVRRYNGRPEPAALWWRSLTSGIIPMLAGSAAAGAAFGSLGAIGMMKPRGEAGKERVHGFSERSATMGSVVRGDEQRMCESDVSMIGVGMIVAAFGLGVLAGAAATLLTTPESGAAMRRRLKRGAETARQELDEILEETKESWNVVRDDAREAVKRTATRIKEAAKVTKEALAEGESSAPHTP